MDVINGDTQNLGIVSRELGQVGLVSRDLVRSYRRPGQWEKGDDHIVTVQVAQAHVFPQVGW
jgi:hypothetical protein